MAKSRSKRRQPRGRTRRRAERIPLLRWLLLIVGALAVVGLSAWWLAPRAEAPPTKHRLSLTPEQARELNGSTRFVEHGLKPPRRFFFTGTPAAREQAIDCLATAAIYEAGNDRDGQRAVIQVVLNRVRSPSFPKTVCGVVYAGKDRATGCQFSFTCDGSMQRRPEHQGWQSARTLARRALSGAVFASVGRSTHYHTDWVVPGWSRTLDKVAQIHSHIFYQPHAASRSGG